MYFENLTKINFVHKVGKTTFIIYFLSLTVVLSNFCFFFRSISEEIEEQPVIDDPIQAESQPQLKVSTITILKVTQDTLGNYTCSAKNDVRTTNSTTALSCKLLTYSIFIPDIYSKKPTRDTIQSQLLSVSIFPHNLVLMTSFVQFFTTPS